MNNTLTEEDLVRIFSYKNRAEDRQNIFFQIFYYGLTFSFFVMIVYFVINFHAIKDTASFWYRSNFSAASDQPVIFAPDVPTLESDKWKAPVVANNHISIPVLDITAPIIYGVNNTEKEVADSLEQGVIHINGTSLPGQVGNIYMTGHSSNYVWSKGSYNSVFSILDKLVIGDKIYVNHLDSVYEYEVFERKIIIPTDTSVLQSTTDSRLTLVTCWPVGTTLKRLVLLAKQNNPDPKLNTKPEVANDLDSLPSGR